MVALLSILLLSGTGLAAETGGAAEYEQAGTRTPEEKAKFADDALAEINGHITHVKARLEEAQGKRQQDVAECLSRKLLPMENLGSAAAQDAKALKAVGGSSEADAVFRRIAVALGKVRDFRSDADACVGDGGADQGIQVASMSEPVLDVDVDDLIEDPWEDEESNPPNPSPN